MTDPLDRSIHFTTQDAAGLRLDRYLTEALRQAGEAVSRTRVQDWIKLGAVKVNDALASAAQKLSERDRVEVWPQPLEASQAFSPDPMDLRIAYLDECLLVVDKPSGCVVHPAPGHWRGTLMNGLLHWRPELGNLPRAGIVHRLDRDTSGLLMVGLREDSHLFLQKALAERSTHRIYLALVHGEAARLDGKTINLAIGRDPVSRVRMACEGIAAKNASTAVRLLSVHRLSASSVLSLVSCKLETGRTHQIRVHLSANGFPIVGDPLYGRPAADRCLIAADERFSDLTALGQALHAGFLQIPHPHKAMPVRAFSSLPWDLGALLPGFVAPSGDELGKLWQLNA